MTWAWDLSAWVVGAWKDGTWGLLPVPVSGHGANDTVRRRIEWEYYHDEEAEKMELEEILKLILASGILDQ